METRTISDKARIIVAKDMTNPDIIMLLNALYTKNRLTFTHSINVGYMAAQICLDREICKADAQQVVKGALLHDIGKIFVPTYILEKRETLTPEEYEIIKQHPSNGVMLLKNLIPSLATDIILDIVENHHERCDGSGYYKKTDLSFYSQLIHAIDAYDALTSDRPYHPPYPADYSLGILIGEGVDKQIASSIFNCCVK